MAVTDCGFEGVARAAASSVAQGPVEVGHGQWDAQHDPEVSDLLVDVRLDEETAPV